MVSCVFFGVGEGDGASRVCVGRLLWVCSVWVGLRSRCRDGRFGGGWFS